MCRAMVQKVVTISDQQQLEKIARECEELPEGFRKTLAYWPVEDVFEVFRALIMPVSGWRSQD